LPCLHACIIVAALPVKQNDSHSGQKFYSNNCVSSVYSFDFEDIIYFEAVLYNLQANSNSGLPDNETACGSLFGLLNGPQDGMAQPTEQAAVQPIQSNLGTTWQCQQPFLHAQPGAQWPGTSWPQQPVNQPSQPGEPMPNDQQPQQLPGADGDKRSGRQKRGKPEFLLCSKVLLPSSIKERIGVSTLTM
jgi:hypothetical protein